MNTASQNLPQHLAILLEKLQHPTDYEKALYYFLEEFAGDVAFIEQSLPEDAVHLLAVLTHVAGKALRQTARLEHARALRLPQLRFFHGNAAVAGRALLFFYFEETDTGLLALIPGVTGGTEIARFRLTGGLVDPKKN